MTCYDPITFYSFLETIRAIHTPSGSSIFREGFIQWLLLDAAHTIFAMSKDRIYQQIQDSTGKKLFRLTLEEPPKWKAILEICREIHQAKGKSIFIQLFYCLYST